MALHDIDPLLFDNPNMRELLEEMRDDYVKQVHDLLSIPLGGLANYQEGDMAEFLCLFNTHVHRYQQAFLYLDKLGYLETALKTLQMRSMLLKPGKIEGDHNLFVPTLRQSSAVVAVGYDESLIQPDLLPEPQIYTRLVVPLLDTDELPWPKGQRVYDALREGIEPTLIGVYPDDHSLLILWSDQVVGLLADSIDPSQLN